MIRRHVAQGIASEAVFSACGSYRYALTRGWDAAAPRLAFVMLNPSTADERANDPTVVRCIRRGRDGGWGAVRVCNLFALRETSPARLKRHPEPEGPGNAAAIDEACRWADAVVAAWGVHGAWLGQSTEVAARLRRLAPALLCLGLTLEGHPRHPLHLPYTTPFATWAMAPT